MFQLAPSRISSHDGHISSVSFRKCELVGEPFHQQAVAVAVTMASEVLSGDEEEQSEETVTIPCDLLLYSVGYRSEREEKWRSLCCIVFMLMLMKMLMYV